MRLHRWAAAATAGLVLAVAPGALQVTGSQTPVVDRAPVGDRDVDEGSDASGPAASSPPSVPGVAEPTVAGMSVDVPRVAAPDGEVFAVLVGINDYPGSRRDLQAAVADVDLVDAALAGFGVPPENRVVLRDGQATLAAATAAIRALVERGGPGATYVLAFTGHVRKLDRDTEAMVFADDRVLRDDELAALVAPAATQRFWFLVSACYSAGFTELLRPGRVLTAAAGANELAWENPDLNASYLVHQMVREGWLRGKAGPSVQEAFAYAHAVLSREHPNRVPVQIDHLGAPLVLGPSNPSSPAGTSTSTPAPAAPTRPPPSTPAATPPPSEPEDDPCVLGIVYC